MDLAGSFIAGYFEYFSHAGLVFDKFHIVKLLNKALDDTSKAEGKGKKLLKEHRFTLLRHASDLTEKQKEELYYLQLTYPELGRAYQYKEGFFDAFHYPTAEESIAYLEQWCKAVMDTSLTYMKKFIATLKTHWSGIITNFTHPGVNNGTLEGLNQKIQLAKRRARGFANTPNFIDMAYFVCGKLQFDYPHNPL